MKVWDSCSDAGIEFSSDEGQDISQPLNYIVENDLTQAALNKVMKQCDNLSVKYSTKVKKYSIPKLKETEVVPKENVLIELENGNILETPFLIGADGFR